MLPYNPISNVIKTNNRSKSCVKENSNSFTFNEEKIQTNLNKQFIKKENSINLIKSNLETPSNHSIYQVISPKKLENFITIKHFHSKQGKTVQSTMHTFTNENSTLPTYYVAAKTTNIISLINKVQSVEELHGILVAMYQREKVMNKDNKKETDKKNDDKSLVFFDNDLTL